MFYIKQPCESLLQFTGPDHPSRLSGRNGFCDSITRPARPGIFAGGYQRKNRLKIKQHTRLISNPIR